MLADIIKNDVKKWKFLNQTPIYLKLVSLMSISSPESMIFISNFNKKKYTTQKQRLVSFCNKGKNFYCKALSILKCFVYAFMFIIYHMFLYYKALSILSIKDARNVQIMFL